jgi:hypothetical protein
VAFYVGEDAYAYYVLSGSQRDSLPVPRLAEERHIIGRPPHERHVIGKPVRVVEGAEEPISRSEFQPN